MRSSPLLVPGLAGLLLLASSAFGCGDEFAPYNRLTTFRVLALRSDPPTPGPNERAVFSTLTFSAPGANISRVWEWCALPGPSSGGYECNDQPLRDMLEQQGIILPPRVLPGEDLTIPIPVELLQAVCAGMSGSMASLDCTGGFPIQIRVTVTEDANGESIFGVRTLRLRLDSQVNTNPTINPVRHPGEPDLGLFAIQKVMDQDTNVPITFDGVMTATLPRDVETGIRVGIPEASAEAYIGPDDMNQPVEMRERLTASWFVETGNPLYENTIFVEGLEPIEDTRANKWTPALERDYPPAAATLVVVVRDNRGGVDWVTGVVNLGPKP